MAIELAIHLKDVVALSLGSLNKGVLTLNIVNIEGDSEAILIGLRLLNLLDILRGGVIFTLDALEEHEVSGLLGELLVGEDAVLDEDFEVVPLLLVVLAHGIKELLKAVGNLAGDVARNLLHIGVALQVATRHIEWDVGRVDDAM